MLECCGLFVKFFTDQIKVELKLNKKFDETSLPIFSSRGEDQEMSTGARAHCVSSFGAVITSYFPVFEYSNKLANGLVTQ